MSTAESHVVRQTEYGDDKAAHRGEPQNDRIVVAELSQKPEARGFSATPQSGQITSPQDMGRSWEAAAAMAPSAQRQQAFDAVTNNIVTAAQKAYQQGGMEAVKQLGTKINDNINGLNGPFLVPKGDGRSIDILHVKEAALFEAGAYKVPGYKNFVKDVAEGRRDINLEAKPTNDNAAAATRPDKTREMAWGDKIPGAGTLPPSPYVFGALTDSLRSDLKMDPSWKPINRAQQELLDQSASLGPEVENLKKLGLVDGAAQKGGVDKVNDMFARHGIPIHMDNQGPDAITAGGVFHYNPKWNGTETKMDALDEKGNPKSFDAFKKSVKSFNIDGQTVIEVHRDDKTGTTMYMAMPNGEMKGYDALRKATELTPGQRSQPDEYSSAIIPKMKVRDEGNVPQLLGMRAAGGYQVAAAKIFTSADIDHTGAEIKQGLGITMTRGLHPIEQVFKIDKPPLVWVTQDGASKPLIAFRVGQESWKDPKK